MEQFTPGPWRACGFSSIVGCPVTAQPDPAKNTFNVCGVAAPVSREENIANARLIAAAPELYEALALVVLKKGQLRKADWKIITVALAKVRGSNNDG